MLLKKSMMVVLVGFLALAPAAVFADFIHTGTNDPTTEGWTLITNNSNQTVNSGTTDSTYWQIVGNTGLSGEYLVYRIPNGTAGLSTILDDPNGWVLSSNWKVLATTGRPDVNEPFMDVRGVANRMWGLSLVDSGIAATTGLYFDNAGVATQLAQVDIGVWHDYSLTYNPSSQSAIVKVDGSTVGTLLAADLPAWDASLYGVQANFGDGNSLEGGAVSRWHSVQLSAVAEVPEPGTLLLLGTGLIGLLAYAWKKRR